jgi:2-iminoacetate synthase
VEACYLAWHGEHLSRRFPRSRLAISFPRLRRVPGHEPVEPFAAQHAVSDADLVQMIVGMRLLFPDAELVLSTREPAYLRDHLIQLGVTRMSAGSRTSPGAYAAGDEAAGCQFDTDDRRQVAEVMQAIRAAGYDVVTKDFDPAFVTVQGDPG